MCWDYVRAIRPATVQAHSRFSLPASLCSCAAVNPVNHFPNSLTLPTHQLTHNSSLNLLYLSLRSLLNFSTDSAMASPSNRISRQTPLNVPPLTSMPSVDPPFTDLLDAIDFDTDELYDCGETKEIVEPSLVFLQSALTMKEIDNILSATSSGVVLGGSAARGMVGPILGKMDIGEDEDSYLFRVALPGVARGSNDFSCDVAPDGQIMIRGHTTTGEMVIYRQGLRFEMVTQNLPPAGHFSISFKLPGPVDTRQLEAVFGIDGILEGIVKKKNPQSNRAGAMEKQETES